MLAPRVIVPLVLALVCARAALGWESQGTHPGVTDSAILHAGVEKQLADYFRQYLGVSSLSSAELPIVRRFDDDIDQDIDTLFSRLRCTQNLLPDAFCLFSQTGGRQPHLRDQRPRL